MDDPGARRRALRSLTSPENRCPRRARKSERCSSGSRSGAGGSRCLCKTRSRSWPSSPAARGPALIRTVTQRLNRPTQTYLGKGKIEEVLEYVESDRIDAVICDDELRPTQQRNLEKALDGVKVIDRTALILDVFGRRAQTREGQLQVELAQHEYLLPRLAGQWSHLERLGGGIGTRGPGETQIETDRRLVRGRIQNLKKSLDDVRRHRGQHRARRRRQGLPVAGLVGYTNAGKSTLLNSLTGASVDAEDRLFSTLDPITRQVRLPSGRELLVTDTVGFIQKLPPAIVAAFRATLEEAQESTMIVHVVDVTHPNAGTQTDVVERVLADLQLAEQPRILALNKTDLLADDIGPLLRSALADAEARAHRAVSISAKTGEGLDGLLAEMDALLQDADGPAILASPAPR